MPPREIETGIWEDRVRLPDGTRPRKRVKAGSQADATVAFSRLREALRAMPRVERKPEAITVSKWFEDVWTAARRKRLVNADCDLGRLKIHVLPLLPMAMVDVKREDLERVVSALDATVAADKLAWKSAVCIWGTVTKAFDDACRAKDPTLRLRLDNPADGVRGPDRGDRKSKTVLYPSEFLRVWQCERIPLRWRRMIAVAIYAALRASELRALRGPDIDLEHRVIHVHAQQRTTKSKLRGLKSHVPAHYVQIEPALIPLLEQLKKEATDARVLPLPPLHSMPTRLRLYLLWAGVTRPELHTTDDTRKQFSWHDLRGTGLTWWAARGDSPMSIMQRAGHANISTTMGYVQLAEAVGAGIGEVFPSLDQEVDHGPGRS